MEKIIYGYSHCDCTTEPGTVWYKGQIAARPDLEQWLSWIAATMDAIANSDLAFRTDVDEAEHIA